MFPFFGFSVHHGRHARKSFLHDSRQHLVIFLTVAKMWKRTKNAGPTTNRQCFSLVHQYIQRFNEVSGSKSAVIRRRSKTPGVMIVQYVVNIPEGKSTPDFQSKPAPVTIKEGKLAVFKVMVKGDPKPEVTWRRAKAPISDKQKFQSKYDEATGEHIFEIHKVSGAETDTYKCYAANEYGKAVCTTTLNVIEASKNPSDFRKLLRKSKVDEKGDGENDERFWDAMLNADRKDYERICSEFGVSNLHLILKKLEEKKKERAQNKCMKGAIPYDEDTTERHSLKSAGRSKDQNIKELTQKGTGLNQVDKESNLLDTGLNLVNEEETLLSTEFKLSNVDFVIKIQELKVQEREDALFACVLTHPLPRITWMGKGSTLEDGEKYSITMSDHKLIHRLLIKDCTQLDKGIYSAVAGIKSCSAWLVVQAESDPASAERKRARKTTLAGGARIDLEKVAREQQIKNREEIEKILAAVKVKHGEGQLKERKTLITNGRDGEISAATGPGRNSGAVNDDMPDAVKASTLSEPTGSKEKAKIKNSGGNGTKTKLDVSGCVTQEGAKIKNSRENGTETKLDVSGCVTQAGAQQIVDDPKNKKHSRSGQADFDKVTDTDEEGYYEENEVFTRSTNNSRYIKNGQETEYEQIESSGRSVDAVFNQNQTFATSQNEVTDAAGNKDSTGSVKQRKSTRKVHWKHPTPEQDQNGLAGEDEARDDEARDSETHDNEARDSEAGDDEAREDESSDDGASDDGASDDGASDKGASDKGASDKGAGHRDEDGDSTGQVKRLRSSKKRKRRQKAVNGESKHPEDRNECDETEDATSTAKHSRRKRQGPLIEDVVIDPGVQFICGLSDVNAVINETAELTCKLSSEDCEGAWFRDGKKILPDDNFSVTKDGAIHKLVIIRCNEEHSGKYRFEADGRKTEAMINVKDPPRFDPEDLVAFTEPVTVKVGHNVFFKLHFVGHEPIKIKWYREGEELLEDNNTKLENSANHSRLLLIRCQRKDTGDIKIKLKNEHGFTEAISQLIVLDKPSPPLGPAEVMESSATSIEFRWRPPKDDGGSPVINYIMERQQVGRNTWKKLGEVTGVSSYRDIDVDRGRKYCYRIRAVTAEGISEAMETDEMQAGMLAFPGPPAPPKVVSASDDCINISWASPTNTGGSRILGYILEKRKKGSNLWSVVNAMDELIKEKNYAVKDVVAGMEYEFRVTAINLSGVGEFSNPSEFVFARDPKKPPGKVTGLKVTETSYSHLVLTWTKPEEKPGIQDEAKGYFVEIRPAESIEWSRCNTTLIITTTFSVKGLKSMGMYWVRLIATNDGGESDPEELANYVVAMPSPVRPKFTNHKMKSFMVVRAGNSVRITINFEASPRPHIMWLKDNVPVTKRVTISNSDGSSQLLIPSSERSDSGIYSILVKNLAGQETFSIEVRVTDDPKPPGLVELEENVPGTVTVRWDPSPDEKRDDRLHYIVSKLDSTKRTWTTVAERLFNNKFTVCNIMHGREYHFRVYAKNDMGVSEPSESPTYGTEKKKEKFVVSVPTRKDCDLRCAPTFIVPLKLHTAPKGYECYMSCAVKGNPRPRITWYRNHISVNTDTNYYISDTCGVCSMLILRVGPRDMGEYTITAENALGRAECSTILSVRE